MNKGILWLFVLLVLVFGVNAINVNLDFPSPSGTTYSSNLNLVSFKCSAYDCVPPCTIYGIDLYTDVSGNWAKTGNTCLSQTNCTFVINGINNGNYKWNCFANGAFWAPANYTFTFSLINDPPTFNGTIPSQTWTKNTILSNAFNLNNYFSDINGDILNYTYAIVSGENKITIDILNGLVTLTPFLNWVGSETVLFRANDGKSGTANSNNVVLTVTESGSQPQEICNDNIDNDNDGNIDCKDSDCGSNPNTCQVATCNQSTYDWEYVKESGIECDSDDDCDSDDCNLDDCTCVVASSDEDDEENSSSGEEQSEFEESGTSIPATISLRSPYSSIVDMEAGKVQKFSVTPSKSSLDIEWYLDNKKLSESGKTYTFEPEKVGKYEVKAVVKSSTDSDFFVWTINVMDATSLAEKKESKEIVTATEENEVISITGYFAKGKDFVIKKWKASSALLGVVVLVIIILVVKKFGRKEDVLAEFGREGFFGKLKRRMREWKRHRELKKTYINKKVTDEVERHVEVHIDPLTGNEIKK